MPSVAITYECPVCHASCPATVTGLDDPVASIAPRTQDTLRKTRAIMVRAGRANEGDPVAELSAEILEQGARSALFYATCPRCGAKNPEGVAQRASDERRWKWITFAILIALAGSAWFVRWIALVLPGLDLFFLRPMAVRQARRTGQPGRGLALAAGIATDVALVAIVVLVPRAAPLVLLVPALFMVVRRPAEDEWPWREAKKKIRFEEGCADG